MVWRSDKSLLRTSLVILHSGANGSMISGSHTRAITVNEGSDRERWSWPLREATYAFLSSLGQGTMSKEGLGESERVVM